MTELDRVIQTRTAPAMGPEVQTVYLVDGDDIAACIVRRANGLWNAYIEACLDPDDPLISNVSYEEALEELLEEDRDLRDLPLVYSLDPAIDRE